MEHPTEATMRASTAAASLPVNRLLAMLPPAEFQRLQPLLKRVDLPLKTVLHKVREPIGYVYFPTHGVASAVTLMENGAAIEVANIGNEGVVGPGAYLGLPSSPNEVFMQVGGGGLRMEVGDLVREASRDGPFRDVLARYHAFFLFQASQSVACNGLHGVHSRCCRWLLMTHDRVQSDELPLTHELLSVMLGVRRASVTVVLQQMEVQGIIGGIRGVITVLNRERLEEASCECYRKVADEYDRLLG
jgi:CRP-like cAMP-binding protein